MRRRSGGFGIFGFFLFIVFLGYYGVYELASILFSLLILGGIIGSFIALAKAISKNMERRNQDRVRVVRNNNYQNNIYSNQNTSRVSKLSNADLIKIDKKLASYFSTNMVLPVTADISLTTQSGKFSNIDSLYLTYKDEKISKLSEFKLTYFPMYDRLLELLLVFADKDNDVIAAEVETPTPKKKQKLSTSEKYIDKINELNDAIPQEEITNGLYQTCDLLKQIELLKESKSDEDKVKKLYDYYLPILIDILEKYKKLQDNPTSSNELKKSEAQLIKTIVLINEALKTIADSMHEDDYMNINADINTLQSLLQKDGYGEDPFGEK